MVVPTCEERTTSRESVREIFGRKHVHVSVYHVTDGAEAQEPPLLNLYPTYQMDSYVVEERGEKSGRAKQQKTKVHQDRSEAGEKSGYEW